MPTYFRPDRFIRDYAALSDDAKERFKLAVAKFVEDLKRDGTVRPSLGIKPLRSAPGIFEFHFDGDGRATFSYGDSKTPGDVHVNWRRVGTHDIYDNP